MAGRLLNRHRAVCTVLTILISTTSCKLLGNIERVTSIDNIIDECLTIDEIETIIHGNLVLLNTNLYINSSIAECGCKSAGLDFVVTADNSKKELIRGVFSILSDRQFSFPILVDKTIAQKLDLTLTIACHNPE